MAIDRKVKRYIEDYSEELKKQLTYIKDNDWTYIKLRGKRIQEHDLQLALTLRASSVMKDFYAIAESSLHYKTVEAFLLLTVDFLQIYIDRQRPYFKIQNWFEYMGEDSSNEKTSEMEFQSDILKNCSKFKDSITLLNLDGRISELNIPVYGSSKISIPMARKIEDRYPKVVDYIKQKREDNDSDE